jgi:AcrR family transcriptional regulator
MPRGFREHERVLINERLLAAGREALTRRGMKKTSVEELTAAVGISKGAFYLFYASKEELFFAVIQRFEAEYQAHLLAQASLAGGEPHTKLIAFLRYAFSLWREEPLFRHFQREDYSALVERLPPTVVAQALRSDVQFAGQLLAHWAADGVASQLDPPLLTALLRALFLISLHNEEFDPVVYPRLIEVLIEMTALRIEQKELRTEN